MNELLEKNFHRPQANQKGFTMVELMVAITLALLLSIVAGQSYLSTKTTYRATEQNSRIQENLRFATHFINREVRRAGNIGCFQKAVSHLLTPAASNNLGNTVRGFYDLSQSVNIWRWQGGGQGGNNFNLSSNLAYQTPGGGRGRWSDAAGTNRPAPWVLNGNVMEGSDMILVTKVSEPLGIRLSNANTLTSNNLTITNLNGNTVRTGQVVLVGDCNTADMFVHTGATQSGAGGTFIRADNSGLRIRNRIAGNPVWQKNWQSGAEVRFVESVLYFIGEGASGLPALFKLDVGNGLGTGALAAQPLEVVDGIEFMKVLTGIDTDADNASDRFLRIDQIGGAGNIINIHSLQIGLLAVGDQTTNLTDTVARQFQITQRHRVTSPINLPDNPALQDTRYRQSTTTTVQIRNALSRRPLQFF